MVIYSIMVLYPIFCVTVENQMGGSLAVSWHKWLT